MFLAEDCDESVRQMLLAEISTHTKANSGVVRDFAFNRFNVSLDFHCRETKIEDDLDTSEQGRISLSLAEFTAVLNGHKPVR